MMDSIDFPSTHSINLEVHKFNNEKIPVNHPDNNVKIEMLNQTGYATESNLRNAIKNNARTVVMCGAHYALITIVNGV